MGAFPGKPWRRKLLVAPELCTDRGLSCIPQNHSEVPMHALVVLPSGWHDSVRVMVGRQTRVRTWEVS